MFPDIFFGDAAFPSSLFNVDDFRPFGELSKEPGLDLLVRMDINKN
jgi:hypothetical protein